jgi:hypothetical protein
MVLALALTGAGSAASAVLPVDGTLRIEIGAFGAPTLTGSGVGSSAGPFGLATVPAGLFQLTGTVSVAIQPPALALSKITVMGPAANPAGSFNPGGAMDSPGIANLFFTNGSPAGVIPLQYIGGGNILHAVLSGLPVTVIGAFWTNLGVTAGDPTKTVMIAEAPAGIPLTITATAYDKRTSGGVGTVQLIAPASFRIFAGNLGNLPLVGTLTLHYTPEPGTLLLVLSGVAGLVAFGRGRALAGRG